MTKSKSSSKANSQGKTKPASRQQKKVAGVEAPKAVPEFRSAQATLFSSAVSAASPRRCPDRRRGSSRGGAHPEPRREEAGNAAVDAGADAASIGRNSHTAAGAVAMVTETASRRHFLPAALLGPGRQGPAHAASQHQNARRCPAGRQGSKDRRVDVRVQEAQGVTCGPVNGPSRPRRAAGTALDPRRDRGS